MPGAVVMLEAPDDAVPIGCGNTEHAANVGHFKRKPFLRDDLSSLATLGGADLGHYPHPCSHMRIAYP